MISNGAVERAVAIVGKGYAQYEYFFDNLKSSEWIEPLRQKGFFKHPPDLEERGNSLYWIQWPDSRYLQRVAETNPKAVASAFLDMEKTENPFVHADLVNAALKMPGPLAAKLSKIERQWIDSEHFNGSVFVKHEKLITHLAQTGETQEALRLAKTLLTILPDSRYSGNQEEECCPKGMEFLGLPIPRRKLGHDFQEILWENIPVLIDRAGLDAVELLADILNDAISFSCRTPDEDKPCDYSEIWFPAIDRPERDVTSQIQYSVALALRDGALQYVQGDINRLEPCMRTIDAREWHVFSRICLYLLSENCRGNGELARKHLLDKQLFNAHFLSHEYFLLARQGFAELQQDEQEVIVLWINEGPQDIDESIFHDEQDKEEYIKMWKCKRFHYVREHLAAAAKLRYDELLAEVGEEGTKDLAEHRFGKSWVGPTSPLSVNEIGEMSDDQLLAFLRDWQEPEGWAQPSPEGLGRVLSDAVEDNPKRFLSMASRLKGYEPTYVRGFLQGLEQAARNKKPFDWAPSLELAAWVIHNHVGELDRNELSGKRDPGWGWTRKTIASLLGYGFFDNEAQIPFHLRNRVWELLAPLCDDPEPTPDQEKELGNSRFDATDRSLNVTRGRAFHALVGYMLWVRRNLQKNPEYSSKSVAWIEEVPEAKKVIEIHLDPAVDPSPAVRSVYGRWYNKLIWLDSQWAGGLAPSIFGGQEARDDLQQAAWSAYIVFCKPYRGVFDLLEDAYTLAVSELQSDKKENEHRFQPEPRLAEHLISFYAGGHLNTAKRKQLLAMLFERASSNLRACAVSIAGEFAQSAFGEHGGRILARLRDLWQMRLDLAKQAPVIAEFEEELSAFGSWFASGQFDEEWALDQLAEVLKLTGKVEPDYEVARRLVRTSDAYLEKALCCLESMVKGDAGGLAIWGWNEEASDLLRRCLTNPDPVLSEKARDFIHWLGAKGYREFRKLLI